MDENVIKSRKIKLGKLFMLLWSIVAALLIVMIVISCVKYAGYKKAQEVAVETTLSTTNYFDGYKSDYNKMVSKMYDFFDEYYDSSHALGKIMKGLGYEWSSGSVYFMYIGYPDYTLNKLIKENPLPFNAWIVTAVILLLLTLWYQLDKKTELTIDGDRIICKRGKKTAKEFWVKDVKSISTTPIKGLKLVGNGVKYKINLVKNGDEIKSVLMEKISAQPTESHITVSNDSHTDDLVKYKELLDSGVITQEEFDAKKKQLLNL